MKPMSRVVSRKELSLDEAGVSAPLQNQRKAIIARACSGAS